MVEHPIPERASPRVIPAILMIAALLTPMGMRAATLPNAGSQLRTIPPVVQPPATDPNVQVERRDAPAPVANDATIVVKDIRIVNAHRFSEKDLIAATQFKSGDSISLAQLRDIASQVAEYYHAHGYFLAQATLPPQDIKEGVVTIAVLEGQYGNVVVRNHSRLSNSVANRLVDELHPGDTVDIKPLESGLLMLSDLPGVEVKSTLTPGASVGAANLLIDVTPGRLVSGTIEADNSGNRYSGEYRLGGSANLNNPFGVGDVASLRVLSSFDGFNYGRASYQLQIDRASFGVAFTALEYELGKEYKSLESHGTAQIGGIYGRYPIVRRRNTNLSLVANLEAKQFRDELDVISPPVVSRKKTKVGMLSLVGNQKDPGDGSQRGSAINYSLTWTTGTLSLLDAQAVNSGAGTASAGHYDKVGLSGAYLKAFALNDATSLSLYASVNGQWATDTLDSSEKLSLGGANSVRAYPEGEAPVDEGYVITVEARLPFAIPKIAGQWEAAVFADSGSGNLSTDPIAGQANRRTLSGAGFGLNWWVGRHFYLRTNYAHKLGSEVATSVPDSNSRFWFNAVGFF